MAIQTAPSFEQLEKLKDTRDADLISRGMLDPKRNRGRGAQTNKSSRFDTESRESFDDGWGQVEELKPFETIEDYKADLTEKRAMIVQDRAEAATEAN